MGIEKLNLLEAFGLNGTWSNTPVSSEGVSSIAQPSFAVGTSFPMMNNCNFSLPNYTFPSMFPQIDLTSLFNINNNFIPNYSFASQNIFSLPANNSGDCFNKQTTTGGNDIHPAITNAVSKHKTSFDIGDSKTKMEYLNNNKKINAGKIKNVKCLADNSGSVDMCNPEIVDTLVELAKLAEQNGCRIVVSSSYRSTKKQKELFEKQGEYGKIRQDGTMGNAARPGRSLHEYGQAVDVSVWRGNTKLTIGKTSTPWFIDCLEKNNMKWGGTFKTYREPWHFETKNGAEYRSRFYSSK